MSSDIDMDPVADTAPGSENADSCVPATWVLVLLVFFRRPVLGISGMLKVGDSLLLSFSSEESFAFEDRLALCLSDLSLAVGDSIDDGCLDGLAKSAVLRAAEFEPLSPL